MPRLRPTLVLAALIGVLGVPVAAQAPATAANAGPFLGTWTLTLDTPQGQTPITLTLKESSGTVRGEIGSDTVSTQTVTDVTRAGDDLVLKYTRDLAGTAVPMKVTLRPVDNKMTFVFDMADGQVVLEGPAVKK